MTRDAMLVSLVSKEQLAEGGESSSDTEKRDTVARRSLQKRELLKRGPMINSYRQIMHWQSNA